MGWASVGPKPTFGPEEREGIFFYTLFSISVFVFKAFCIALNCKLI
jgi:hypothetical protein